MTRLTINNITKRKPIMALKPGTFFVLNKDSNLKDVVCIKLDDDKKYFDFDECCIHSYGDESTTSALLCKAAHIYVRNEQTDRYYENFSFHYPTIPNRDTVKVSDLYLTVGDFFTSYFHPMIMDEEVTCYDDHLYLKLSDNEYFDLMKCIICPINDIAWHVNKLDNVEISVSI